VRFYPAIPYLSMAVAMAIVGSSVVAGKIAVEHMPVMLLNEFRFIGASAILLPMWWRKEPNRVSLTRSDIRIMVLQTFTGVFLFNLFMLNGVKLTSGIASGIITSTIPAVVGIIAFLFLRERLNAYKWLGILFAVAGTFAVNLVHTDGSMGTHIWLGNLLVFGAVLGESGFIIFGKSLSGRLTPLTISTATSVIAMVMMLPFAVYDVFKLDFSTITLLDWFIVAYFAVFVTVVAFVLMNFGLSKVSASTAGIFTGVLPLSSMVCSVVFLKEKVHAIDLLAVLLVMIAIFLISVGDALSSRRLNNLKRQEENHVQT
jgi:drug/metabolite transporter (DMT)-like permease